MASFEAQTPEYPCESLRARLINSAPSILIVISMLLAPGPLAYLYCQAGSVYVGIWGYFPLAFVTVILCIYTPILYWTCSSNLHSLKPADTITKICRAACIIFHVGLFTAFWNNTILAVALVVNPDKSDTFPRVKSFLCTIGALGTLLFIYGAYYNCRANYYEKAIMRANSQRYGDPVLVCIPVIKLCGHIVLYTSTHKYELRLDRTTSFRPYFLHRPLLPFEQRSNTVSPKYHLFICGWTSCKHEEIVQVFNAAIREFGVYTRLTNNCRTFLQWGCIGILDLTSVWHQDMLFKEIGVSLLLAQMGLMMYRSMLREFCRWFWSVRWGPDWESSVHYEGNLVDLADHDVDLRDVQATIRVHIGDQYDIRATTPS
ncbi:hypothetical protein B0H16DRAFT_1615033 [Mycena metata]|uniref:Uncharacterized protein n=1 Tax=Mycena metata TaxID=1033252 RepID=A0AAD7HB22_9AGAR|nr:hypothetical protein B0H16DRAFT_1615033 [Mycena metata]